MNSQNAHTTPNAINISAQILRSCLSCFPCFQRHHQIHPTGLECEGYEYLQLDPQRRIRIIHIDPKRNPNVERLQLDDVKLKDVPRNSFTANSVLVGDGEQGPMSSTDSSINEYWFTHWKRPVKIVNEFRRRKACNCSCRSAKMPSWKKALWRKEMGAYPSDINCEGVDCVETSDVDIVCDSSRDSPVERYVDELLRNLMTETFEATKKIVTANPSYSNLQEDVFHESAFSPVLSESEEFLESKASDVNISKDCSCFGDGSHFPNCQTDIYCYNSNHGYQLKEVFKRSFSENITHEPRKEALPISYTMGCVNLAFLGSLNSPDDLSSVCLKEGMPTASELPPATTVLSTLDDSILSDKTESEDIDSGVNSASLESQTVEDTTAVSGAQVNGETSQIVFHEDTVQDSCSTSTQVFHADQISDPKSQPNESTKDLPNNFSLQSPSGTTSEESRRMTNTHGRPRRSKVTDNGSQVCSHTCHDCSVKPLLFFLHGVGGSADIWSAQLAYFVGAGYEVVAPDLLGHGYSSAPDNRQAYMFHNLLQDVIEIFDTYVRDHRRCIVVGHSYGSCFAAALARRRPHHVSQLVLISSGGPTPLAPQEGVFSLPTCMLACVKPLLLCGFKREMFYSPRGKQLRFSQAFDIPPYVLRHVMQGQDWPEGDGAFHRRILVPTLLVHGLQDPFVTLVEECEMERTIPRSILEVIPTAGHLSMLETPGQISHMIHCFITWWDE